MGASDREASVEGEPFIGCKIKTLDKTQWADAAANAIRINPSNRPATQMLARAAGVVLPPEHIALMTSKYWGAGGVHLTVSFMDTNDTTLKSRILSHMNTWGRWCNASFSEVAHNAQVRIARQTGKDGGYWSYLGTDILSIPADQPTMNLESFSMNTPESEYHRVVRHETGHTLGFPHEHLRKEIVSRIDPAKAKAYFLANDGWDAATTTAQVLTPIAESALTESAIDPASIMCYALPGSIMKDGVAVPGGLDIDAQDAIFSDRVYPKKNTTTATIWPNGKAYFFKGSSYIRYDPVLDKADPGYPAPIAGNWPGFPASFAAGVDAWVLWNNGKAYFFKGNEYIRYDVARDHADVGYPQPIANNWPGLGGHKIDCGVVWPNGKAYFFSGSQYLRYDIAADHVDAGYPAPIAGNWPGLPSSFTSNLDAAVVWDNGYAYFFKGAEYVRYDIALDRMSAGYPKPITGNWPGLWPSKIDA